MDITQLKEEITEKEMIFISWLNNFEKDYNSYQLAFLRNQFSLFTYLMRLFAEENIKNNKQN